MRAFVANGDDVTVYVRSLPMSALTRIAPPLASLGVPYLRSSPTQKISKRIYGQCRGLSNVSEDGVARIIVILAGVREILPVTENEKKITYLGCDFTYKLLI